MNITKVSDLTGIGHTRNVPVDPFDYEEWKVGNDRRHVQDAFPHLSIDDREFLLTGITPEEWNEYIGEEPDEEDFEAWAEDEDGNYTGYEDDFQLLDQRDILGW